ncbi:LRR receptor-like serine/threonine-protein kinase FLS2 isoform X2 [Salvia splendens]|uniref:LRR receptor-like serine/threonine-protein kinase FLS2 isoform X2 n=1 Tax=Salvia splendens TaxID=180675 RepID=UPI001C268D5B|nr:LRR receptor-like serine/threonine-protein kinase FLS2 isoform X2 [Salvia splendens]
METSSPPFSLALVLLTLTSVTLITSSSPFSNSTTDQDALLAFKNAIILDSDSILISNWSANASVCSWTGVSCSLDHQRVTALNFSGFLLHGTISPHLGNLTFLQSLDMSSNNFTGSIPSELSNIQRLQTLNLASNQLVGGLPSGIFANMSMLVEINLSSNKLSGELPSDICTNTPKLKRLFLTENKIDGKIPKSICKCGDMEDLEISSNQLTGNIPTEIGNLTKLTFLSMFFNHLEGDIPSSVFNISSLEIVYLGNNMLTSSVPIFNSLTRLQILYLDSNNLIGDMPKEIGYLTSLQHLILNNNSLTGHIPKQIGNLTMLKTLFIDSNKLTGELPEELGNLKNITLIQAQINALRGSIPHSIFNLSTLKVLSLSFNHLSGRLPPNIGLSLVNLEELYLSSNRLTGEIPTTISNASMLTSLELNNNSFTGSIPHFDNLRSLEVLRLWGNNLTGADSPDQELTFLSSLTNCPYLETLDISHNPRINGVLPPSVGNLSASLTSFQAFNCSIRGVIPSAFGNLSNLQTLDLSTNNLTGFIPATMGKLKQLGMLLLYNNRLGGYIPRDLCRMSKLINLGLYANMLVGSIPECLGDVKSLRMVAMNSNKLSSTLPSEIFGLADLILLDLSSNNLSGQLPYIGRLKVIYTLNLSSNKFSGSIPESIGGCESLVYLDLSNNTFNASIPQSVGEAKGLKGIYQMRVVLPCLMLSHFSTTLSYVARRDIKCHLVRKIIQNQRRWRRPRENPPTTDNSSKLGSWKLVSEKELEQGTSSFSETNLLGKGSIGSVFKATLADGRDVAVKKFNLQVKGAARIFETESHILSTIRHRNLVKIHGCCSNPEFKALILAYMPNGSLEKWLHSDKNCLDLVERLQIAIDVALALEYLHHDHIYPVAHCDIKPSNVLLDADMTAHVGDFGIAKLFDHDEAAVHTIAMGTIGYVAPEFVSEGMVSTTGDVYSYGILLLEMFTSKKPIDDMFNGEMSIKEWVGKALNGNQISVVVASVLVSIEDEHSSAKLECVTSVFELAMKCVAFLPHERINMKQVVAALQKIKAKFTVEDMQKKHRR